MNEFVRNNIVEENHLWLMTPAERCALIGLLSRLKPERTLEIGHRFGGCTGYLAEYSGEVSTVDLDPQVIESSKRWDNVIGHNENSINFLSRAIEKGSHFNFAVVDGDHSRTGAATDLALALQCCDIIVLHDTMNPECRQGYLDALEGFDGFANLDFVLNSGIWGGLGIVVTNGNKGSQ